MQLSQRGILTCQQRFVTESKKVFSSPMQSCVQLSSQTIVQQWHHFVNNSLRNNFTLAHHTVLSWKVLKTGELHKKTSVQQPWHKSVYEFHLNLIVVAFGLLCFSKQYEVFLGEPSNPWFSKCSCGQWRIQDAELVLLPVVNRPKKLVIEGFSGELWVWASNN